MEKTVIFVDTNIWLDFYRSQTGNGVKLLRHLTSIQDKLIISYQVEMEFKKNRQSVIHSEIENLEKIRRIEIPAIYSDAKISRGIASGTSKINVQIEKLKTKLLGLLQSPATKDPVYKISQRIFHKNDSLNLDRRHENKRIVWRKAFRRYILGCPPRKDSDLSMGDAINWEWMVECAKTSKSNLLIVSRDGDYGLTYKNKSYLNDHLTQEFKERVGRKRVVLCKKLSDALKLLKVQVTKEEESEEENIIQKSYILESPTKLSPEMMRYYIPGAWDKLIKLNVGSLGTGSWQIHVDPKKKDDEDGAAGVPAKI